MEGNIIQSGHLKPQSWMESIHEAYNPFVEKAAIQTEIINLDYILKQLFNFKCSKFEKNLTDEDADFFRPYMISYHVLKLQNKRLRQQLRDNGIEPEEVVPPSAF